MPADNPTSLNASVAYHLLDHIIDKRLGTDERMIDSRNLSLKDVEDICAAFNLPLRDVLECATIDATDLLNEADAILQGGTANV